MPTAKKTIKKSSSKKNTSKQSAAKVAVKKVRAKKSTKKQKKLVEADNSKCFWTTDGQVLKNLKELEHALRDMSDRVYLYHATKERNDFAEWVEHVLLDKACADALRASKKPKSAATIVVRYLKVYS